MNTRIITTTKRIAGIKIIPTLLTPVYWLLCSLFMILAACQSNPQPKNLGKPKIISQWRYLQPNHGLEGQLEVYQRNQLDSLVPDAQLYQFWHNKHQLHSQNIDNNYHSYQVTDTIDQSSFLIQMRPWDLDLPLSIPQPPDITLDSVSLHGVLVVKWETSATTTLQSIVTGTVGENNLTLTAVFSDSNKQTILKTSDFKEGSIIITAEEFNNFQQGKGSFYVIVRKEEKISLPEADWINKTEAYSPSFDYYFH